uniref:G_PROTEIN_RECEP_F1_2 domain-containing protein n=1 Tax=Steinernema glaseri TaxID=37863 RepID=A0A1I7YIC1_9BILA
MSHVPEPHRIILGTVYSVLSIAALPLYLHIIALFLSREKYRQLMCYVAMAQIGLFDCVLLFGQVILGVLIACDLRSWTHLNYIVSAITNTGWNGLFPSILLLAVNRLDVICALKLFRRRLYAYALLALCWLFAFCFFLLPCLTPFARIRIDFSLLLLDYDLRAPLSSGLQSFEYIASFVFLGLTLTVYGAIVLLLMKKRRELTSDQQMVAPAELRLMVQGSATFLSSALIVIGWHTSSALMPKYYWVTATVNLMIILNCGYLNPLLILAMNKEVREDVLQPFRRSKMFLRTKRVGIIDSPGVSF